MESIGQILRSARERKRISLATAAAKTRIKIQHLEMMERDDFSGMPAPMYARGFIRIYADFLGLDPLPLVQQYNALYAGEGKGKTATPSAASAAPAAPPSASARPSAVAGRRSAGRSPATLEKPPPAPREAEASAGEAEFPSAEIVPPRAADRRAGKPAASAGGERRAAARRQIQAVLLKTLTAENLKRAALVALVLALLLLTALGLRRCARLTDTREPSRAVRRGPPAVVEEPPEPYLPLPEQPRTAP